MPNITVNPTRMELTRLKGKLRTAQRGHKLLKDKRDELMKQFLDTVREVRALRQEVEEELMTVHGASPCLRAHEFPGAGTGAAGPKQSVKLTQTTKNIMSVNVPVYDSRHRPGLTRTSTLTGSRPPPASWTRPWTPWERCSGRC